MIFVRSQRIFKPLYSCVFVLDATWEKIAVDGLHCTKTEFAEGRPLLKKHYDGLIRTNIGEGDRHYWNSLEIFLSLSNKCKEISSL